MIFIKSIFIGIFAIFPGVSGSALAISLNLYDRIIVSLKNINNNKLFLIKILIGIVLGVILGSNIIMYLSSFKNILYYIFIGLIISDIPFMIRKVNNKGRIRYVLVFLSFIFSTITLLLYKESFNEDTSFLKMIFGGILFSFGKIFPGVSSSFFLIILGIYKDILILFSNPVIIINNFFYYFPFIIGTIIGLLVFVKLLNYLLIHKYDYLYSILLGLLFSSIISILPKFNFRIVDIIGVLLLAMSTIISFKFKQKKEI